MSVKREVTTQTISGVLVAAVSGAIALIFESVRNFIFSIFTAVWAGVLWVWARSMETCGWLASPILLPRGIAYLLLAYVTFKAGRFFFEKLRKRSGPIPYVPSVTDFTEFRFKGLIWRWDWQQGRITHLLAHCPSCDRFMRHDDSRTAYGGGTQIFCTNCPSASVELPGDFASVVNDVQLEILHLVRTEGWKAWVGDSQSSSGSGGTP